MAESALVALIPNVGFQLGVLAVEEINTVLRVKDDLKKLKQQFEHMLDIIKEAEQMNKQDTKTKHWLKQLRDDVYRTDDIIDLCRIEVERRKAIESTKSLGRHYKTIMGCSKGVYVNCQISQSIRELNIDIEKISRESTFLQERYFAMHNELIGSLCDTIAYQEPNIVGEYVENDKTTLVTLLKDGNQRSLDVLAIVGTVGIGKTTLARHIYRSMKMNSRFNKILWVCVGKDTGYLAVLRRILTSTGNFVESGSREQLESTLENTLTGKKFLLVLDDVWNDTIWENMLENHLQCGATGSKVLVTTRHRQVARRMGAFHVHNVKKMPKEDGCQLLCKRAQIDMGKSIDKVDAESILDRCDGLPLVIRAVGGVLRYKEPTKVCLEKVCNNIFDNLPEEVRNLIRLSYVDLPSALKKCFLYCSLFPPSPFVIEKRYITQQWVSEGFIEAEDPSKLEEIAEECYRELIARSLLEPARGQDGDLGARMPIVFSSLAKELARDENFSTAPSRISREMDNLISQFDEPRRLSFPCTSVETIPNNLWKTRHLRTLLLFENKGLIVDNSLLLRTFRRLKFLRVLDIHKTSIDRVPDELGKLVHLRYLNLSETGIKTIPRSIRNLRLLQFLILNECKFLQYLSRSIGHLRHLRSLEIPGENHLEKQRMKFVNLREMNCLRGFVVGGTASSGWPLSELRSLSTLTSLQILRPERATLLEAIDSKLDEYNKNLRELELCCVSTTGEKQPIEQIFDYLQPAPSIVSLKLERYYGGTYPSWLCTEKLPHLQSIELSHCTCEKLPAVEELPLLRSLVIKDMKELRTIGSEQLQNTGSQRNIAFPKLETLEFKRLEKLESWSNLEISDMPCIQTLVLKKCSKLKSIPQLIWRLHESERATLDECPDLQKPDCNTNSQQQVRNGYLWWFWQRSTPDATYA